MATLNGEPVKIVLSKMAEALDRNTEARKSLTSAAAGYKTIISHTWTLNSREVLEALGIPVPEGRVVINISQAILSQDVEVTVTQIIEEGS